MRGRRQNFARDFRERPGGRARHRGVRGIGVDQYPSCLVLFLDLCGGHASDGQRNRVTRGDTGQRPVGPATSLPRCVCAVREGIRRGLDRGSCGARGRPGHRRGQGPRAVCKEDAPLDGAPQNESGCQDAGRHVQRPDGIGGNNRWGREVNDLVLPPGLRSCEKRLVGLCYDQRLSLKQRQDVRRSVVGISCGIVGRPVAHDL